MLYFYAPSKRQKKTKGFLMFPRGIEMEQGTKMS